MGKLVYSFLTSLDGYVADDDDNFDWAMPDEEVHSFINDLERSVGTYIFGRKLYETMAVWETPEVFPDPSPAILEFARLWGTADKIVFSKTLRTVTTKNTRIESEFDPAIVRELKERSSRDVSIGGPTIAAEAIRHGLVDEYSVFVSPVVVGGGNAFLPDHARVSLELLDERRFRNGMVYLRYGAVTAR